MHLHYLSLHRLVTELRPRLLGAHISESFSQNKDELILAMNQPDADPFALQLSSSNRYPYFLLMERFHRRSASADVMTALCGQTIRDVSIAENDRIISISFESGLSTFVVRLFANHTNFFVVSETHQIQDAFKNAMKLMGTEFAVRESGRQTIEEQDEAEFHRMLNSSDSLTPSGYLKQIQHITSVLADEIVYRSGLSAASESNEFTQQASAELRQATIDVLTECENGRPRIYYQDGIPLRFSLCALDHLSGAECRDFDSINEALRRFCFEAGRTERFRQIRHSYDSALARATRKTNDALTRVNSVKYDPEKEAHFRQIGELLAGQPGALKPGQSTARIVDYYDAELAEIEIKINPKLNAQENAEIYFRKAKKQADAQRGIPERRKELEGQLRQLRELKQELDAFSDYRKLENFGEKLRSAYVLQARPEQRSDFRLPYKRHEFRDYEIWVGKNARDNDSLTFKYASRHDFWFHTQGYSGSHVVVRNPQRATQLPPLVLERAAQLAVTNSGAKHASYVPVLYTQIKHVRKPRKSPAGTVIPERTKTIYVDPL